MARSIALIALSLLVGALSFTVLRNPTVDTEVRVVPLPVQPEIRALSEQASSEQIDDLPVGVALDETLGTYATRYRAYQRGRSHNVELAARKLDGVVIAPGETISFNETVGPRTGRQGFRRAPVIDGGELVPGMGGGVCQVASTLHGAALRAGLEIVEAQPHSRPSGYMPLGLDAAVAWPQLDLKIANPYDFPVMVSTHSEEGQLTVELVGDGSAPEIEIERRVLTRIGFREEVVVDPALAPGERQVSQTGIRGARIEVTRTIRDGNETRIESQVVRYPSTPRVVRVGA